MFNLEKNKKKDFQGIYKACGNKFNLSCGSYLIDGQKYKYDKRMIAKQSLLYNLAKQNSKILEIGVYMGHSILIMLTSNPKLKITGLDIDKRFAPKAVNYLKKFTQSKIKFILGDSLNNLKKIRSDFDLYHIDGDHRSIKIYKEILACIELHKRKKIKILFDDIDMMKDVEKLLFASFKINKSIKPKCIFRNLYVEIELNKNSIQKFKKKFLFLYFKHYITILTPFYIKRFLRFILKILLGEKICKKLEVFLLKWLNHKNLKSLVQN